MISLEASRRDASNEYPNMFFADEQDTILLLCLICSHVLKLGRAMRKTCLRAAKANGPTCAFTQSDHLNPRIFACSKALFSRDAAFFLVSNNDNVLTYCIFIKAVHKCLTELNWKFHRNLMNYIKVRISTQHTNQCAGHSKWAAW